MSDFIPPSGFMEVDEGEARERRHGVLTYGEPDRIRFFVREQLNPPLPVVSCTVIRVALRHGPLIWSVFTLLDGLWRNENGDVLDRDNVESFAVVSEPRAVTAKAVLDRVRNLFDQTLPGYRHGDLDQVADEFGVPDAEA